MLAQLIATLNNWLYTYILVILLIGAGLYFTVRTRFVQFRMLGESFRVIREKGKGGVSSFQALMVSTASRVGTGNIAGVSAALCLGGVGAVFWMWVIALLGGASAFVESTLAQIYKVHDGRGGSRGGPAYYIEAAVGSRGLAALFAVLLILTYMVGFNLVASFNLVDSFAGYGFFDSRTPLIAGAVLALLTALCIFGGGKRLTAITSVLVPVMGGAYVLMALVMIVLHLELVPGVLAAIFENAFDFQAIFGGFTGSAMMYGIKRGLFSNEAGVGSAPNAAAAANVSHPVKQGLAQILSVFLDTLLICSATAFLCLCSGVEPDAALKGVPYVQAALAGTFGAFGHWFITGAMLLFAFTTILGNYYYCESNFQYLLQRDAKSWELTVFRLAAVYVVFLGARMDFSLVWDLADVLMGGMVLINLPVIWRLSGTVLAALRDYTRQKAQGKDPFFRAADVGLEGQTDFWN
ncbi:alanine/glycine:cation symporter family protein [Oscillibacter sp.]|uniref:alanine/glycine:cation symporter family protein n=1 Tax=Oscillibacter sp. TaxID=1945593 RepID=UPI001B6F2527|nr:alanine/glycine:cation symporter family protein [Oscillibacter sp.]MBP3509654.1 alanine:cation symporter family protein [Oscillibacter sp.]